MKKLTSFVLFILLMTIAMTAFARPDPILNGDTGNWLTGENFTSEAAVGDVLYCLAPTYMILHVYDTTKDTDTEISALILTGEKDGVPYGRVPITLVSDGQELYAVMGTYQYREDEAFILEELGFYRLIVGKTLTDEFICHLDLDKSIFDQDTINSQIVSPVYQNGKFLFTMPAESTAFEVLPDILYVLDTVSGELEVLTEDYLIEKITAYEDGSFLISCSHIEYDESGEPIGEYALYILDADTEEMDLKAVLPAKEWYGFGGMAYWMGNMYFLCDGSIWKLTDFDVASAERIINSPDGNRWRTTLMDSGLMVCANESTVYIRDIQEKIKQTTLVLGYDSVVNDGFLVENPGISLTRSTQDTTNEVISTLITQSSEVDIYFFTTLYSGLYYSIRDKGYALPLDSEVIIRTVDQMYPSMQELVQFDGQVVALPCSGIIQSCVGVNHEAWIAIGLSQEELPKTWAQFLLFLRDRWSELAEQYPQYALFADGDGGRETIYYAIVDGYGNYRMSLGEDPGYDTPEFREVLELYRSIDFETLIPDENSENIEFLFNLTRMASPAECGESTTMHPLTFLEGQPASVPILVKIAVINPYSQHKKEALAYLEYLATHMDPEINAALSPYENDPVERADYSAQVQEYEAKLAWYDEMIAEAEDEEQAEELQAERQRYQTWTEEVLAKPYIHWLLSEESIASYRSAVEDVVTYAPIAINETDWKTVIGIRDRFLEGGMSVDQFIEEMNRMQYMSRLEDQ